MIKRNQKIMNWFNAISDMVLILIAYLFSIYVRYEVLDGVFSIEIFDTKFVQSAIIYSFVITGAYYLFHLYESQRIKDLWKITVVVFAVNAAGIVSIISALYLFKVMDFSRGMLVIFWLASSVLVWLKHALVKAVLNFFRAKGYNLKHVAIIGNGHLAYQYIQDVKNNPELGFKIDGYISAVKKPGLGECLGSYEDVEQILDRYDLDELVVALEPHEAQHLRQIIAAADKEGVRINLIPFYNDYYPAHPIVESVGRTRMINLRTTPLDNIAWAFVKRLSDIVLSIFFIILTSPIMVLTAVIIKLSSPGPVIFKQERVGKNKKPFMMLKFRSMRMDVNHEGWSTDVDARKTTFGSFIRKFSIDEFPQFFNVLVGHMSLVGPRPETVHFVKQFKEEVPLYLVRQQIRPGMTGWAQVKGFRGNTSIGDRVECDIWYIENWSVGLDIKIILKTIFGGMINSEKVYVGRRRKVVESKTT